MIALLLLTANLAAIGVLSFAMFTRRSHRIEFILVLLTVNILTFAATTLLSVGSLVTAIELAAVLAFALAGALTLAHRYLTHIGAREVLYAGAALAVGFATGLHTVAPVAQLAAVLGISLALGMLDWARALARPASETELTHETVSAREVEPVHETADASARWPGLASTPALDRASARLELAEPTQPITLPLDLVPQAGEPERTSPAPKPRQKKPVVPVFIPPITAPEQVK